MLVSLNFIRFFFVYFFFFLFVTYITSTYTANKKKVLVWFGFVLLCSAFVFIFSLTVCVCVCVFEFLLLLAINMRATLRRKFSPALKCFNCVFFFLSVYGKTCCGDFLVCFKFNSVFVLSVCSVCMWLFCRFVYFLSVIINNYCFFLFIFANFYTNSTT